MASLAEAVYLIMQEGMIESEFKKQREIEKYKKFFAQEGAEEAFWKAIKDHDPKQGQLRNDETEWKWRIASAKLSLGDFTWEGWGFRDPRAFQIPQVAKWWDGKPCKRLVILGEQGLGDEIMFASCLNEVPAKEILLECEPRLETVFQRSFPGIEVVGRKALDDESWAKGRIFDAQVLMGDLPTYYRRSRNAFPTEPYLRPISVDDRYKGQTGISWIGRQGGINPDGFDRDYLSLQYGTDDHKGFRIPDIDLTNDIEGLFSVVAGLKKVVSVPTTIVHIAGSMGIPVELILPPVGLNHGGFDGSVNNALNWRLNRQKKDFYWHPSVKVYGSLKEYERIRKNSKID